MQVHMCVKCEVPATKQVFRTTTFFCPSCYAQAREADAAISFPLREWAGPPPAVMSLEEKDQAPLPASDAADRKRKQKEERDAANRRIAAEVKRGKK